MDCGPSLVALELPCTYIIYTVQGKMGDYLVASEGRVRKMCMLIKSPPPDPFLLLRLIRVSPRLILAVTRGTSRNKPGMRTCQYLFYALKTMSR